MTRNSSFTNAGINERSVMAFLSASAQGQLLCAASAELAGITLALSPLRFLLRIVKISSISHRRVQYSTINPTLALAWRSKSPLPAPLKFVIPMMSAPAPIWYDSASRKLALPYKHRFHQMNRGGNLALRLPGGASRPGTWVSKRHEPRPRDQRGANASARTINELIRNDDVPGTISSSCNCTHCD
jgi:hypothetical protein